MRLERRVQFGFGGTMSPVVRKLLIANIGIYALQTILPLLGSSFFLETYFALQPNQAVHHLMVWQFLTYAFLHGSFFHLFFNMFTLWMFGSEVERAMQSKPFLHYYLLTAIGAGVAQVLVNWGSSMMVLGASGAIYGVLVAFALFYPNREIYLLIFFVLPVRLKAKYLVLIFVLISFLSSIQLDLFATSDNIAHMAHFGGAVVGFLYLRSGHLVGMLIREWRVRQWQRRQRAFLQKQQEMEAIRNRVDSILDRINQVGYENISKEERQFLKKASEVMAKENVHQ
ncbi:MAG TPA: rhomboid family intramembrane serine protease [bacterium]|nr:rhomboid family intramembrane serine protease [bacterium]HPG44474.1 rhomboid family intramembrane serine protease [bacterium]HPM97032.1 rhomboid family intramembrane serine protease [bacterium]